MSFGVNIDEMVRVTVKADNTLKTIKEKRYDNFDQYEEVSKITDLEVAKLIIKRLLDERQDLLKANKTEF